MAKVLGVYPLFAVCRLCSMSEYVVALSESYFPSALTPQTGYVEPS